MCAYFNSQSERISRVFILIVGLLSGLYSVQAQTRVVRPAPGDAAQADKISKDGAVFKIPEGYSTLEFADFKGVLMIDPLKPTGMFVTYPKKDETTELLRQRLRAAFVKMFIRNKDVPETAWQIKLLPPHVGDSSASVATYSSDGMEVQIATYERTENSNLLVYGYFAMRHKVGQADDGRFLDEQGKGVEDFDKLWKSFGGKKY